MNNCCFQPRCARTDCVVCARRYAGRLTRRILNISTGKLFAIETKLASPTLADFRTFRIEARNFVDHRRRCCCWWREFMLHVWLSQSGWVRGVSSLGSLTSFEVLDAFQSRWPTCTVCFNSSEEMLRTNSVAIRNWQCQRKRHLSDPIVGESTAS